MTINDTQIIEQLYIFIRIQDTSRVLNIGCYSKVFEHPLNSGNVSLSNAPFHELIFVFGHHVNPSRILQHSSLDMTKLGFGVSGQIYWKAVDKNFPNSISLRMQIMIIIKFMIHILLFYSSLN
jgi:hypothetical protein